MRRFLIVTNETLLRDKPHLHAKILTGALLFSNGVRKDSEVVFYIRDVQRVVKIVGSRVKRLFPDVESSYGFLKKAIYRGQTGVITTTEVKNLTLGITVGPGSTWTCIPTPPFTYVIKLVDYQITHQCNAGVINLPPHHQVVVLNIVVDRMLEGRKV
ncbi:MAG: hypothetical protein QXY12_02780 [Pyrobaculum sp.]